MQTTRKKKRFDVSPKPYNSFGDYLNKKYSGQILKLPINAGFSCPNRDGKISFGGCIFCAEDGSASPSALSQFDVITQMNTAKEGFKRSSKTSIKYIAYFQAFTNTYNTRENLKLLYDLAVTQEDIIGLMIATRPDCLQDDVIDLIAEYAKDNFELWVELGMQSSHNKSLDYLNRGHNFDCTKDAIIRLADKNIPVCTHIILGIPQETWDDMMYTANVLAELPIAGIKFHQMHIIKNTRLAQIHNDNPIPQISMKEYVSYICDFLERTRKNILIHRLTGDRDAGTLIAPLWGLHKGSIQKAISDEFEKRGTHQGFLIGEY